MSLDRTTTVQSQKSITYDTSIVDETIIPPSAEEALEKGIEADDEYEGIHNRGWICALGAFTVNFFLSGSTLAYGNYMNKQVFNPKYLSHLSFRLWPKRVVQVSFVGSMQTGLTNILGLILPVIIQKIGYRGCMHIGTILAPMGLICASFTTQFWQLYITQGLMYGVGSALSFQPAMVIPAQYLHRNRALAAGISICGSGIGGLAFSPIVSTFIAKFGVKTALRYHGIIGLGIMIIGDILCKPKFEMPKTKGFPKLIHTSLLTFPMCLLLVFSFLVPFGYLVPFYLVPMYSVSIGLTVSQGALIVAIGSGVNAVSRVVFGTIADHWLGRVNVMFLLTFISGVVTMLIWPFAKSFGVLLLYFILYSGSAGVFQSVLPAVTAELVGIDHIAHGMTMYFLAAGPGFLLGTPLAGQIFDATNYVAAIEFSGAISVLASAMALWLRFVMGGYKLFTKV
ncbi:major facilitator superfamily domain-containing protein [Umbelopsis sp. PMI_123]|nr:major facilitator superfamily domain-containing protein [Umbelopsis sp. PMI_123]